MKFSIEICLDNPCKLSETLSILSSWAADRSHKLPAEYRSDVRQVGGAVVGTVSIKKHDDRDLHLTDDDRELLRSMQIGDTR